MRRIENGTFAITVEGVDRANSEYQRKTTTLLLNDHSRDYEGSVLRSKSVGLNEI